MPGDNVAYLKLGMPTYRISQMVKHSGSILNAHGWVNVVSPAELPIRGVVGARLPDWMMFVALYCKGQFELTYLAPLANSMGLLLLPRLSKRIGRTEALVPNPVLRLGRRRRH